MLSLKTKITAVFLRPQVLMGVVLLLLALLEGYMELRAQRTPLPAIPEEDPQACLLLGFKCARMSLRIPHASGA